MSAMPLASMAASRSASAISVMASLRVFAAALALANVVTREASADARSAVLTPSRSAAPLATCSAFDCASSAVVARAYSAFALL